MINKIKVRIGFIALIICLIFGVFGGEARAQSNLLMGQNHYYTVIFRGNGEAVVYARLVLNNPEESNLSDFSFEIPGVSANELVIYQQNLGRNCVRNNYQNGINNCIEYSEPDYNNFYYYNSYNGQTATYQKLMPQKEGSNYKINLANPIAPYKSGAVIVSYTTKGYVKQTLGLYKFNFETIKVPARIQTVRVAVDIDSDLYLKGKRSEVKYASGSIGSKQELQQMSISSPAMNNMVGSIGNYGTLTKEAKNLSPNESFNVKGEYAKSQWRLYLNSIIGTMAIVGGIIAAAYFGNKRKNKLPEDKPKTSNMTRNSSAVISVLSLQFILPGLLSVVSVYGLTRLIIWLSNTNMSPSVDNPAISIMMVVLVVLLYAIVLFGPAIFVAAKSGWKGLLAVIVTEVLWFFVFFIIYLVFFQTGLLNSSRIDPVLN